MNAIPHILSEKMDRGCEQEKYELKTQEWMPRNDLKMCNLKSHI